MRPFYQPERVALPSGDAGWELDDVQIGAEPSGIAELCLGGSLVRGRLFVRAGRLCLLVDATDGAGEPAGRQLHLQRLPACARIRWAHESEPLPSPVELAELLAGEAGVTLAERQELKRLRAEVEALRSQLQDAAPILRQWLSHLRVKREAGGADETAVVG